MPGERDADRQQRLIHLIEHGNADDLDELARLLGQTDPWTPPPPPAPLNDTPPGPLSRMLDWFRRRRNTDPQAT